MEPSIDEARGLLEATTLCKDLNMQHVLFEGDCVKFVEAILNKKETDGPSRCLTFVRHGAIDNSTWKIRHVKKEANGVAHTC